MMVNYASKDHTWLMDITRKKTIFLVTVGFIQKMSSKRTTPTITSLIEKKISTKTAGDKPFLHKKLKIYSKTLIQLNQFFLLEMGKNLILFCYIQTMTHYQTTILAQIRTD